MPDTGPGDLDPRLAVRFLPEWVREERTAGPVLDDGALGWLRKLRVLTRDENEEERLSVGGVLMATRAADRWLPGAMIEAVRYRGGERDANYQLDARQITGPLDQQVLDALAFVRRNMSVYAVKRPGRIDLPQYSERAIFEALVNAVAHRDYSIHGSRVRLFVFDDRLELFSPGGLPNSITVDSMGLRQATRNELIASLLVRCPLGDEAERAGRSRFMDRRGEGVPVIVRQSLRLAGREPHYRLIDEAELMLTVYAAPPPVPDD